jgi:hypothetical protein
MPRSISSWATRIGPWQGVGQGMIEDRCLDLRGHPIGVRPLGTEQAVEQPVGAVGLKIVS